MGGGTLDNRINGVWSPSVHRTAQEFSTILLENSPKFLTTNNVMLLRRKIFVVGEEGGGNSWEGLENIRYEVEISLKYALIR